MKMLASTDWANLQQQGWRWVENHSSPPTGDVMDTEDVENQQRQHQRLAQLKEEYGEENVATGNGFSTTTLHPSGVPGAYGVYVRETK